MVSRTSLLVLAFALFVAVDGACDTSAGGAMNKCYLTYFSTFQFGGVPTNFTVYQSTVDKYEKEAFDNIKTVCNRYNALSKCIGDDSCVTGANLAKSLGIHSDLAAEYVADYKILQYTCGDGMNEYKGYWNCTADTSQCTKGKDCTTLIEQLKCSCDAANKKCGKDAANFGCKKGNLMLQYALPCTSSLTCNYNAARHLTLGFFPLAFALLYKLFV